MTYKYDFGMETEKFEDIVYDLFCKLISSYLFFFKNYLIGLEYLKNPILKPP